MIEFLNAVAPFVYWFLIVSSVLFGISLAVNRWLFSSIIKVRNESDKNFKKYVSERECERVNFAINVAKTRYATWLLQNEKNKKIIRKNKFRKALKLKDKPLINSLSVKDVFVNLLKEVYEPFESLNGRERGYLSFSKNEIFSILNSVTLRVDEILSKSGAKWLKNVKIAVIVKGFNVYSNYKNFFSKLWVMIVYNFINFFAWFFRVFSPVSISKYFIKNLSSQNLSTLISDTLIEVIAKELAVIYKNNRAKVEEVKRVVKTAI